MPYIPLVQRMKVLPWAAVKRINPETPGELNYVITSIILRYLAKYVISYARFNEVMGVLESIKQELYRREVAPYEDKKIMDNGDIYGTKESTLRVRGGTADP